jgi:DNA-directed RNA polymerase alpha subunit
MKEEEPNPLFKTLYELNALGLTFRTIHALESADYDGDYNLLAAKGPHSLLRIKNLGRKSVYLIARALEKLGAIPKAHEWVNYRQLKQAACNLGRTTPFSTRSTSYDGPVD